MTQPAKAQEPSMEEILASIRRIIADDDPKAAVPAPVEPPRAAAPPRGEPVQVEPRSEPLRETARRSLADLPPARSETSRAEARQAQPVAVQPNSTQQEMDAMLASLDDEVVVPLPPAAPVATDVLELTESMAMKANAASSGQAKANSFRTIEPQNDVEFSELADMPAPEAPPPPEPAPRPRPVVREAAMDYVPPERPPEVQREPDLPQPPPLLSGSTVAAVDSAFNALTHTVFAQNARTLEDLVKEMLRPMLKSWLDDNLPEVVERIVRAEIERVSRGR